MATASTTRSTSAPRPWRRRPAHRRLPGRQPGPGQVALCTGTNYAGTCWIYSDGAYDYYEIANQIGNDNTRSVIVGPQTSVTLHYHAGLTTPTDTFNVSEPNFYNYAISNQASGWVVTSSAPFDNNGDGCPDPIDRDHDGLDDATDPCPNDPINDPDGDGVCGAVDNCDAAANADQADTDADSIGDACDTDADNDGISDDIDNCPTQSNANQADADNDAIGDNCDPDRDGDGLDNDGRGDACETSGMSVSGRSRRRQLPHPGKQ